LLSILLHVEENCKHLTPSLFIWWPIVVTTMWNQLEIMSSHYEWLSWIIHVI
jgi:hypothetical protein